MQTPPAFVTSVLDRIFGLSGRDGSAVTPGVGLTCPQCDGPVRTDWRLCPHCGALQTTERADGSNGSLLTGPIKGGE